jgi:hypothetical protein
VSRPMSLSVVARCSDWVVIASSYLLL